MYKMPPYALIAVLGSSCVLSVASCHQVSPTDDVITMTSSACREDCNCSTTSSEQWNYSAYYITCVTSAACLPFDVVTDMQSVRLSGSGTDVTDGWMCQSTWLLLELDVSRNNIRDVLSWRNVANSLRNLSVAGNSFRHVTHATFAGFSRLRHLDVSDNEVDRLDSGCFRHLTRLLTLCLMNNWIDQLPRGVFDGLTSLVELRLDGNRLTSLGDGVFAPLSQLTLLSATRNQIQLIHLRLFDGALRSTLQSIDLSRNLVHDLVETVTPAIANLEHLHSLRLDGNPTEHLHTGREWPASVRQLSISHMPRLIAVHRGALSGLSQLTTLQMSDNPRLRYVDTEALPATTVLDTLYLHDNNLTFVSRRLLANGGSFTLYGNPLQCDCHLRWITSDQCADAKSPLRRPRLIASNRTRCMAPDTAAGQTVMQFLVENNDTTCAPSVIALFDSVIYLPTGSMLRLDCRVTGLIARVSVVWITPIHFRRSPRIIVEHSDTGTVLTVRHLRSRDAGTYRCLAEDETGNSSSATTVLRLYNVDARVLPVYIGTTSVMITWSGTESTLAADYAIVYRLLPYAGQDRHNNSDLVVQTTDKGMIHLRPYLRKYTVNSLRQGLMYEFCITTEVAERRRLFLHCTQLATKQQRDSRSPTMISLRLVVVVVLTAVLIGVLALRCVHSSNRGGYRPPGVSTDGVRRSSSLLMRGLPLKQLGNQLTGVSEHVMTSQTSLVRAIN